MFTVRRQHEEAFSAQSETTFEKAAVAHLREELANRVSGKSTRELTEWVRDAAARALQFGLTTQRQIMCFVDSEALLGIRFYQNPEYVWAAKLLESDESGADDKARLLLAKACSSCHEENKARA